MIEKSYTNGNWVFACGVHCIVIRTPWIAWKFNRPTWLWRFQYNYWK